MFFKWDFCCWGDWAKTKETVLQSLSFVDDLALELVKLSVGIRIYPNTPLADQAIKEGRITSHENLLAPTFCVVNDIKDWIYETVGNWAKDRSNWML